MKFGDLVVRLPAGVKDTTEFKTRSLLTCCLEMSFPIMGFDGERVALDVGEMSGNSHIWKLFTSKSNVFNSCPNLRADPKWLKGSVASNVVE